MRTADGYIVRKCLEGDSAAFGLLVERYKEGVYALAYSKLQNFHDAEDVTQEVFIKAYRSLRTLRQWESFHAWIYSITSNLCKDWLRAQSRRPDREFIADQNPGAIENHRPENPVLDFLHDALDSLPETYRQVLTLYYLSDMNTREIAEFLGMSPSAVRQRLSRARSQLKEETLAMMSIAYERQRLPAGFTFRMVEAVKRIKIHPAPRITSVPWGLSLATGIVITVLSLSPHLSLPRYIDIPANSASPDDMQLTEPVEVPVDMLEISRMPATPGYRGYGDGKKPGLSPRQNAILLAPAGDNGEFPEEPSVRLGKGTLKHIALSPDGKLLAVAEGSGMISLYNADSLEETGLLKGHTNSVYCLTFSPDGKLMASGSRDRTICLWHIQERRQVGSMQGHTGSVDHIAFSPDGKTLASGSIDKTIRLWDVEAQKQIGLLQGHTDYVNRLAFSPDGKLLASCSGGQEKAVRIWDVEEQREVSLLEWPTNYGIFSVAFSPDGKTLASGFGDRNIHLWDVETQEHLALPREHTLWVNCVVFSPDGELLASGSGDKTIRIWNVQERRQIGILGGHADEVFSITFSPDGKNLTSMSYDGTVCFWDVEERKKVRSLSLKGYTDGVVSLAFSPDGKILASGSDSKIRLWDVDRQEQSDLLQQSGSGISPDIAFSPDGGTIASCAKTGDICFFDVEKKRKVFSWRHKSSVDSITFSPDGKLLAIAGGPNDNGVYLWDVESRTQVGSMKGHTEHVLTVAFSPDRKLLASGARDDTIRLWDVEEQKQVGLLEGHTDVDRVVFTPDGSLLIAYERASSIRIWDVQSRKQLGELQAGPLYVVGIDCIAISPDGKILASSGENGEVWLWDIIEQRQIGILKGHIDGGIAIAFSPDGRWLATGGYSDGTVLLWEMNIPVQGKSVESTGKLPRTWGEVKRTALLQNFPNPFNPETWIPFSLSEPQHVMIKIYSSAGQLIRTLDLGHKPRGEYLSKDKAAYWDGSNDKGEKAASDVYFYVMDAGVTDLRKMVMVR